VFKETAHYDSITNTHTIALNQETGFAYANGTTTCGGGLHMIEEVVERGQRPEVIRLAERMRTGQRREVALLQTLVAELDS